MIFIEGVGQVCFIPLDGGEIIKVYTSRFDRCFKCIFLNPSNKDLLSIQIREVTGISINRFIYSNVERNSNNINVKKKILDTLIESKYYSINIEVNARKLDYVNPRNTSYNCDTYSNDTKVRGVYSEDKDIIQINYSYGLDYNEPLRVYTICDKNGNQYVKNFIIYEINMDYIMDYWYNRNKQEVNIDMIKKYKYFIMLNLRYKDLEELIEITQDERIVKYMEELKKVNSNPKYRKYISEEEDELFIRKSLINQGRKIGRQYGVKIGEKRGFSKGELKKQFEIAKNSLKAKLDINTISEITGLSINQIKSITL